MGNCYCPIPLEFLVQVVREKFYDRIPTVEIIKKYPGERERQFVETIALLDVPEADVRKLLKDDVVFLAHFLDCRKHALQILNGKIPDLGAHLRPEKALPLPVRCWNGAQTLVRQFARFCRLKM